LKTFAKSIARIVMGVLVFPAAFLSGFGRFHEPYLLFAQALSLMPGIVGSYLRVAYYHLTLEKVGSGCQVAYGSYFAHATASFGNKVGIGAYCILGRVEIGDGAMLASQVQVISGSRQHVRRDDGTLTDEGSSFKTVIIGAHTWIGAGAIVMADVGSRSTIGAGSVVTRPVPDDCVAVGNPARVIRGAQAADENPSLETSSS
jgi:acetyltransferase-like isoleucine patch superfamily enzyme